MGERRCQEDGDGVGGEGEHLPPRTPNILKTHRLENIAADFTSLLGTRQCFVCTYLHESKLVCLRLPEVSWYEQFRNAWLPLAPFRRRRAGSLRRRLCPACERLA